ncbi:MAG TPA: hypothetical protein VMI53_04310, partial [Opitutaceae bacterium]|nr:hypothetical protein [Opitutaceae bacterium]
MPTVKTLPRVSILIFLTLHSWGCLQAQTVLPFSTDFESPEGFSIGSIQGQNGWEVIQGSASIGTASAFSGTQSLSLDATSPPSIVVQSFAQLAGQNIIFVDFYSRPSASTDSSLTTLFDLGASQANFVKVGSTGEVYAFNGDGTGGGNWQATGFTAALNTNGQSQDWIRFTFRQDYSAKKWDLFLNGEMAMHDLGFRDNATTYFSLFTMQGTSASAGYLDYMYIGSVNPLFEDADQDGLPDSWEQQYLGTLNYGPNDDPGGVGRTLLQSYQQGLSPWPTATV